MGVTWISTSFAMDNRPTTHWLSLRIVGKPDEKTDRYDYDAARNMLGRQVILTTGTIHAANTEETTGKNIKREVVKLSIADVVETGVYQFDSGCIYMPIEKLSQIMYPQNVSPVAEYIHIKIADTTEPDVALAVIRGVWRNFVKEQLGADPYLLQNTGIETSRQFQSRYIAAYKKQMGVLLAIFGRDHEFWL